MEESDIIAVIILQYTLLLIKKFCIYGITTRIKMKLYYDDLAIISLTTLMYDHMILFRVIMIQDLSLFR